MVTPLRILHIDDNAFDRAMIRQVLEQDFPQLLLHQVADEQGLLDAVAVGNCDVVLCDYLLPWTDGLTILRAIKERWPEIPVLMVTGSGNEEVAIEAIKAGLDDYILKSPNHLARLPTAIRTALDRVEQRHRLREIEVRFHALFDRVPVGLYRATRSGDFVDVNPALVDILGYRNRESLMAVNVADLYLNPEDRDRWQQRVESEGVVRHFEAPLRRCDGSVAWVRNSARSVRDAHGWMLFYEGSVEDITERRRAEEGLAEHTRQLDALRAATAEIARELDLTTVLSLVTRRAAELLGGVSGEIFLWNASAELLVPTARWGPVTPAGGAGWRLGEGMVGAVAQERRGRVVNHAPHRPSGRPSTAEGGRSGAAVTEPLLYGERLLGVIVIEHEGTTRQFTEENRHILALFAVHAAVAIENARLFGEVTQATREWENTFDAAADMIAVLDLDYRMLRVNRALARQMGTEPSAIIGRRCYEVFEGCEGRTGGCAFARCVESRQSVTEERELPGTGGVFLQTYSPFLDAQGKLVGVVQVSKNVTAQRQLQQQLMRSEKMVAMGHLISGVAHELNNPLTAIFGNAQLLMLGTPDEVVRQRAQDVVREADRAAKIVRNLLAFARPYKPDRQPLALNQVIEETLELRASELTSRRIAVVRSLDPCLPSVLADRHQIQQVLVNLLLNAEQALSDAPGREILITTHAEPAHDRVTVTIADNGSGIPPDILGRIFDPFFTTKDVGKGTGLGLAICYSILQEHGGRIRAGNRPQGGAWFEFELPAHAGTPSAPVRTAATQPDPTPTHRKRILVADDEEAIVRFVGDSLRLLGHDVDVARDGRLAGEKLSGGDYDLVLMDMKMPGLDGVHLYEEVIRRKNAPPRVVVMTGDTISLATRAFLERTGLRCLEKPFTLEDIWECARDPDESAG